jgi:hypothetical protein
LKLSILICHVPERAVMLADLLECLEAQYKPSEGLVEVLVDSGKGSVGEKRNRLLDRACGAYTAFVDDDDMVADNYIQLILEAIWGNPDAVGIQGVLIEGTRTGGTFEHSIRHKTWENGHTTGVTYTRPPNHLNPIRREIAIKCRFPEISFGEDKVFSEQVAPLITSECMISQPIYLYYHRNK